MNKTYKDHISIVLFQIYCGGVLRKKLKNCVTVQIHLKALQYTGNVFIQFSACNFFRVLVLSWTQT